MVTFEVTITRSRDGGFMARCSRLGADVTAATLAELEQKLKTLVESLYDNSDTEEADRVFVVVQRSFPPNRPN